LKKPAAHISIPEEKLFRLLYSFVDLGESFGSGEIDLDSNIFFIKKTFQGMTMPWCKR
jgi:hypothetical protein